MIPWTFFLKHELDKKNTNKIIFEHKKNQENSSLTCITPVLL